MISICNIRDVQNGQYDAVWAVVRSMKNPSPWMAQVQALSPSSALFYKYLDLKKAGNWNESSFNSIYVPQFLQEMQNPEARALLNKLVAWDRAGKRVALVCFCGEENLCHRSILAGMLRGAGCNVKTQRGDGSEYAHFYAQFKALAA